MGAYAYKARNGDGEPITGTLEAASEQAAMDQLRGLQYTPVRITLVSETNTVKDERALTDVKPRRVRVSDLMVLCINLSNMVSAGIPLLGALKAVSQQLSNPYLASTLEKVADLVTQGLSLSGAVEKFPDVFSKFFVNMVRVGEVSGTLEEVLKTLSIYMERQEDLRQKIRGALAYPTILIVAGVGVILLILTFVMPQFVTVFTKAGIPLPLPTKIMYQAGTGLKQYGIFILAGIVVGVFVLRLALRTKPGRIFSDRLILKLPLFGPLTRNMMVARFSRTLGSLLDSGVALLQALDILKEIIDNAVFEEIVQEVRFSAEKGDGVHKALVSRTEFPKDAVYMISVGEKAGKMGAMLYKVADFYESKVEFAIKELLLYIEPAFIITLGGCVGVMLASVILPMFDMVKTIQR
ncbi:MAG: type II secretion system F family protein [Candidatus Omnitrophica bacterium]|nr:type II secretion system F family protein [Candidatus Omnitrophota bacterium]